MNNGLPEIKIPKFMGKVWLYKVGLDVLSDTHDVSYALLLQHWELKERMNYYRKPQAQIIFIMTHENRSSLQYLTLHSSRIGSKKQAWEDFLNHYIRFSFSKSRKSDHLMRMRYETYFRLWLAKNIQEISIEGAVWWQQNQKTGCCKSTECLY